MVAHLLTIRLQSQKTIEEKLSKKGFLLLIFFIVYGKAVARGSEAESKAW